MTIASSQTTPLSIDDRAAALRSLAEQIAAGNPRDLSDRVVDTMLRLWGANDLDIETLGACFESLVDAVQRVQRLHNGAIDWEDVEPGLRCRDKWAAAAEILEEQVDWALWPLLHGKASPCASCHRRKAPLKVPPSVNGEWGVCRPCLDAGTDRLLGAIRELDQPPPTSEAWR